MPTPSSPRLSLTILLTILAGVLGALAGILGNIATSTIPAVLLPYIRFAWPVLGVVVLLGIGVSVLQAFRDARAASSPHSAQPASLPAQQLPASADYYSCILSYASEDQAFAQQLYTDLQSKGVPCWFAPQDLKAGDKLRESIYEAIQRQDKLLLVLSEHAIGSAWVEEEVEAALDREHQHPGTFLLFPIRLDDRVLRTSKAWAVAVRQRYIGDFRQWQDATAYQQAVQRLSRDIHV